MTDFRRIIKYCAIAFGIFLTVSIIGGICGALRLSSKEVRVVLTIPEDHVFEEADIEGGIGSVRIAFEEK